MNLALQESFTGAKNQLYGVVGYCGYVVGRGYDPNFLQLPQTEQTNPVIRTAAKIINPVKRYAHSQILDHLEDKAITGDDGGQPSRREAVQGIAKIISQQIPRLTPYVNQMFKSQLMLKNPALYVGSIVALFGAALMISNPNIRSSVVQNIGQATQSVNKTGEKVGDALGKKIVTSISPTVPINLAIMPVYKPQRFNV